MAYNSLSKFHSFDNHHRILIPEIHDHNLGPRICVICMASYNVGILFGKWIDASLSIESIYHEINDMLLASPIKAAENWAIYAYDGFSSLILNQYEDIELIHLKAIFIKLYGEWCAGLLEYYDGDLGLAEEAIVDHYHGKFKDPLGFAELLFDKECGVKIPDQLKLYINYEMFKEDVFKNDYYTINENNSYHVFSIMKESSCFAYG